MDATQCRFGTFDPWCLLRSKPICIEGAVRAGAASKMDVVIDHPANPLVRVARRVPPRLRGPLRNAVSSYGAVLGVPDCVGLTFDDGPDPIVTPGLLDALSAAG